MAIDRCTDTHPHGPHRAQYGPFGVKDCPGVTATPEPVTETDHGKPYTDADVETAVAAIARSWGYDSVAAMEAVPDQDAPMARSEARAVLDALTAAGWQPPTATDDADRAATLAQIADEAERLDDDLAAGRVSDRLGDPPPAAARAEG